MYSPLYENNIKSESRNFKFSNNVNLENFDDIATAFFYVDNNRGERQFEFNHQSFQDYFLAEYYLGCLEYENRDFMLNVGMPNQETLNFFKGLVDFLFLDISKIEDNVVKQKILDLQTNLISMFDSQSFKFNLEENSGKILQSNRLIFDNSSSPQSTESYWHTVNYEENNHSIHKWLALITQSSTTHDVFMYSESIKYLIRSTCLIPGYDKFKILDGLSFIDTDLHNVNLTDANLSGVYYNEKNAPNFKDNHISDAESVNYKDNVIQVLKLMSEKLLTYFLEENLKYKTVWQNQKNN